MLPEVEPCEHFTSSAYISNSGFASNSESSFKIKALLS